MKKKLFALSFIVGSWVFVTGISASATTFTQTTPPKTAVEGDYWIHEDTKSIYKNKEWIVENKLFTSEETSESNLTTSTVSNSEKTSVTTASESSTSQSAASETSSSSTTARSEKETSTTSESESSTNSSVETSTEVSTQSSTVSSTEPSDSSGTKLDAVSGTFPVAVGQRISREQLLSLVTFDGDKNNLDITIEENGYVYVAGDASVYHYDLDDLLSKANLTNLKVMSEAIAKELKLRLATENNDKNLEDINTSLPGLYRVTFTDKTNEALSKTITVTIGDLKNVITTLDQLGQTTTSSTTSNPRTSLATQPSSTVKTASSVKTYPKTNDSANYAWSILGLIFTSLAGIIYKKIN